MKFKYRSKTILTNFTNFEIFVQFIKIWTESSFWKNLRKFQKKITGWFIYTSTFSCTTVSKEVSLSPSVPVHTLVFCWLLRNVTKELFAKEWEVSTISKNAYSNFRKCWKFPTQTILKLLNISNLNYLLNIWKNSIPRDRKFWKHLF